MLHSDMPDEDVSYFSDSRDSPEPPCSDDSFDMTGFSSQSFHQQQQQCNYSMERTKLSIKQIRHALPEWMFEELVDTNTERRVRKTRRGNRAKRNRDSGLGMSPPSSPEICEDTLSLTISLMPKDLQRCFAEWQRERSAFIAQHDVPRQQEIEHIMWSAVYNINQSRTLVAL
jgi:hypothetical protein